MERRREISLEEKIRYLREVENIHRLSKKVLPPKGTTWARIADKHLQRALGMPVREEDPAPLNVRRSRYMDQHSPRTARVIERTLRNGMIHPDALHHFRRDLREEPSRMPRPDLRQPVHDTPEVMHYVQHGGTDLVYPHGHLQGFGFVPSEGQVSSHVQLEETGQDYGAVVPTKTSAAAGSGYH